MKRIHYYIPAVSIFLLLSAPALASAATVLRFESPTGTIAAGMVFPIQVLVNAGQPLNAYDVTVAYQGPIGIQTVSDANSIIAVWQNQPSAQDGTIALRGGSFSAFNGSEGELATIYVRAESSGTATFSFINSTVYAADGQGTAVVPETVPMTVSIMASPAGAGSSSNAGTSAVFAGSGIPNTIPQISFLKIVHDDSSNKDILSFLANDGGSGLAGTFVRYRTFFAWSPWQPAVNYAVVPAQVWEVGFRATNNEGTSAEQTIYDINNLMIFIGELVLGLVVVIGTLVFWVWRRWRPPLVK